MTNKENILNELKQDTDKLAELLVTTHTYDNGDYGFDGEDEYWEENMEEYYLTPFCDDWYYDWSEAVQDTKLWLDKKAKKS